MGTGKQKGNRGIRLASEITESAVTGWIKKRGRKRGKGGGWRCGGMGALEWGVNRRESERKTKGGCGKERKVDAHTSGAERGKRCWEL